MSGSRSRNKGAAAEREVARLLGAKKVSRMYQPGPDLVMSDGRMVEVKRRKDSWRELYRWLADDAQLLALRADREPWLVVMTVDTFLDMLDERVPGFPCCGKGTL